MINMRFIAGLFAALGWMHSSVNAGGAGFERRLAMAVESVELAQAHCGFEITARAAQLIAADRQAATRPYAGERAVLANLWHRTWACERAFAGDSCMAARLQLCHRAYGEFGPGGVRIEGLIGAIIHK